MNQIQNIKQVVKDICQKNYDDFYKNRVEEILKNYEQLNDEKSSLFNSKFLVPNTYIDCVVGSILASYSYHGVDFDVEVFQCTIPLSSEEIAKNKWINISQNFDTFWVKDLNIRVCIVKETLFQSAKDKIKEFYKNNTIQIESEKDVEMYNTAEVYFATDYKTIFKMLYGDNKKSENIIEIIEEYNKKVYKIWDMSAEDMFKVSRELFVEAAVKILIEHCTLDCFSEQQKSEIIDELKKLEEFDEIIKMMFTFIFTFNSIKRYDNLNFLDYTFISVELFKITELVFNRFLNIYWKDKKIKDENSNNIEFSNKKLELGKMNQFYKSKDKEIVGHLKDKINLTSKIDEILPRWISKTRNGFLHKDVLDIETLAKSIEDSINVLFLIIATIKK